MTDKQYEEADDEQVEEICNSLEATVESLVITKGLDPISSIWALITTAAMVARKQGEEGAHALLKTMTKVRNLVEFSPQREQSTPKMSLPGKAPGDQGPIIEALKVELRQMLMRIAPDLDPVIGPQVIITAAVAIALDDQTNEQWMARNTAVGLHVITERLLHAFHMCPSCDGFPLDRIIEENAKHAEQDLDIPKHKMN